MTFVADNMLSVLIACLIILIYVLIKKKASYFSNKGFPYVKPTFLDVFRSMLSTTSMNKTPLDVYEKEKHKGIPYIGFFHTFLTPSVLVLDPAMVENILIKDFSHFHDHGINIDTKSEPLAGHLFNMKGDQWRTLRYKLLPTFTSGKLKGMVPTMDECGQTFIDELNENVKMRKDVNLKELFKSYTLSVIARCVFAIDPKNIKDPDCEFRQLLNKVLTPSLKLLIKFTLFISFPKIAKILRIKMIPHEVEDFFMNLTKDALKARKSSGMKRNDFIQLLLELKEKGSVQVDVKDLEEDEKKNVQQAAESETSNNKLEMTDELLAAQSFVFIVAGFDNTSYLAAITMYFISKHKDVQRRIREEVREALSKHGGMNYPALKDMKLLDASINEALRIHPALVVLLRECNKNFSLADGVTIEKGMQIMIPIKSFQKDSKYWPDPERFNPDRFLSGDNIEPGTYLPFGDGPRICIAQRLALLMVKIILAKLIINFELQPSSKTKEPLKQQLIFSGDMEGGLWGSFDALQGSREE